MTPKRVNLSNIYHFTCQGTVDVPSWEQWSRDLDNTLEDQWEIALAAFPIVSLFPTQRLTQLFLSHRTYQTPEKLFTWQRRDTPVSPKCDGGPSNLIHMLWRFPKLHRYWKRVLAILKKFFQVNLAEDPCICFLSIVDEKTAEKHFCTH